MKKTNRQGKLHLQIKLPYERQGVTTRTNRALQGHTRAHYPFTSFLAQQPRRTYLDGRNVPACRVAHPMIQPALYAVRRYVPPSPALWRLGKENWALVPAPARWMGGTLADFQKASMRRPTRRLTEK